MDLAAFFAITIQKAKIIREHYEGYTRDPTAYEASIEDLRHVISEYTEKTINVYEVPWNSRQVKGRLDRYKDHANIYLPQHMPMLQPEGYETHNGDDGRLTYCEKRFVLLKELGHLVIDTKDAFAENADDLVRHAVQRFARLGNGVCQSENLAAIFAGEVLFPFHQRKAFYERYQNGSMSSLEIAILFRIPQKVVEDFLSKDYHELCVNLYDL